MERIYLDNAATSWPKAPETLTAILDYYETSGSSAGRGNAKNVMESTQILSRCRSRIAKLLGGVMPTHVVFTHNATDALNQAIHGFVRSGDHVVASVAEHNSILRPLQYLEKTQGTRTTLLECDEHGVVRVDQLEATLKAQPTRLACFAAVSNVTGVIQPLDQIGQVCRKHGVALLVDAAQAMGHSDFAATDIDFVAASGHKGLLGPQGTGFLYVGPHVANELQPIRQGGTGSQSESLDQPEDFPYRLESGTQNVGGIAGLLAGIEYIVSPQAETLQKQLTSLVSRLREQLNEVSTLTQYPSFAAPVDQIEIVSFNIEGIDPQTLSQIMESNFGFQVRAGFHCAPQMHESLGTKTLGGAVRVSPGLFTNEQEIEKLIGAVKEIVASFQV